MLLSTRNFLLYLLAVGFLVVAITTTAMTRTGPQEATVYTGVEDTTEQIYEAEAVPTESLDRGERLRTLRAKIAALGDIFSAEEPSPEPVEEHSEVALVTTSQTPDQETLNCTNLVPYRGSWVSQPVTFTVVEGARLVTRDVAISSTTASGTPLVINEKQVLAQLPLSSVPAATVTCPTMDVVGIAQDGSLIRNGEVNLYTVFGSETLVGYALDGFPIYGTNAGAVLDTCGGTSALGQYRYYLDTERPLVLNCFSGEPIEL